MKLSLSSSLSSKRDDEFQLVATTSAGSTSLLPKWCKNIFTSPEVVGALDWVSLPDRGTVFVSGAIAKALEHDLSEITLSRTLIRCSRGLERQKAAAAEQKESLWGTFSFTLG